MQSSGLTEIMNLDLNTLPNAEVTNHQEIRELCGYDTFAALMNEAQKAVLFISTQKVFDPTFWIDKNPEFANIALINMAKKNKELFGVRSESITSYPWSEQVFMKFDKFGENEVLHHFREIGIRQLGITSKQ